MPMTNDFAVYLSNNQPVAEQFYDKSSHGFVFQQEGAQASTVVNNVCMLLEPLGGSLLP